MGMRKCEGGQVGCGDDSRGCGGGGGGCTNCWAPRTRKRHQQEHRPQRLTERSDPTQHAKGRTGDCPGPRQETANRRNVTRGVRGQRAGDIGMQAGTLFGVHAPNLQREPSIEVYGEGASLGVMPSVPQPSVVHPPPHPLLRSLPASLPPSLPPPPQFFGLFPQLSETTVIHSLCPSTFGRWYLDGATDNSLRFRNWCGGQGGALVLGQEQDSFGGSFSLSQTGNIDVAYLNIYSTAFDSSKVAARAALGAACPDSGEPLAAAWAFDGSHAAQATDLSGNGEVLSIVGAPPIVPYSDMPTACSMLR